MLADRLRMIYSAVNVEIARFRIMFGNIFNELTTYYKSGYPITGYTELSGSYYEVSIDNGYSHKTNIVRLNSNGLPTTQYIYFYTENTTDNRIGKYFYVYNNNDIATNFRINGSSPYVWLFSVPARSKVLFVFTSTSQYSLSTINPVTDIAGEILEGGSGIFTVSLSDRQPGVNYSVAVNLTGVNGAVVGTDTGQLTLSSTSVSAGYTFASNILNIPSTVAGTTGSAVFNLSITTDSATPETGEGVTATLSNPTGGNAVIDVNSVTVSITVSGGIAGYAMGGAGGYTDIDGIRFSDETAINPAATLSNARAYAGGASSSTKGYSMGGSASTAASILSSIAGFRFIDTTVENPTAIVSARRHLTGVSSNIKGYAIGGYSTTLQTEIDGILFSNETSINPSATISKNYLLDAGVQSSSKGYIAGENGICGIVFSSETSVSSNAVLPTARYSAAGVSSSTSGYIMGGQRGGVNLATMDKLTFSDETSIGISATLSVARWYLGSGVSSPEKGYALGGTTYKVTSEIDGILFSNETAINPSATLSVSRSAVTGVQG